MHGHQMLERQRDPSLDIVHKTRQCFLYKGLSFRLDTYNSTSHKGMRLLEVFTPRLDQSVGVKSCPHLHDSRDKVELPPFLKAREVTNDREYRMYNLAKTEDAAE